MVRPPWSWLVLAALPFGCVAGAANDDLAPVQRDAVTLADGDDEDAGAAETATEDAGPDDAAPPDDTSVAPPEDTGAPDAIFPAEDTGCTPSCTTCGGSNGCGGTCLTGACGAGETCVAGKCIAPTKSYLAPGDYAFGTAWARGITWSIGSESPSTIRYTLDGSAPGPTSPSKPSPAEVLIGATGTTLKWYADNGAKEPTVHSFVANILASGQGAYGFIPEKTNLLSKGPVVVVAPGASLTGTVNYTTWVSSGCPACGQQLVYGIGTTSAGCVYHGSPGVYPGASGTGVISVKAPSTAGTYTLNMTYTLQLSCAAGMATNPLGVRPTAGIATIVVK